MGELRFLPGSVVAQVAKREGLPLVVAQGLAARAVLDAALGRRRHQAPPYQHIIERDDRNGDCA